MSVFLFQEGSSAVYEVTLVSELDAPIPDSQFLTLTLTYYDVATGTVLNGRTAQNVLDANNVTVDAVNGLVTWTFQPADWAIVDPKLPAMHYERHRALFQWTWSSPVKYGVKLVDFLIQNILFVP